MSYTMYSEYFEGDQLTDYSTVKYEEDRYTTSVIDISNEQNLVLQSKIVSAENFVPPAEAYLEVAYELRAAADNSAYDSTDNIALVNAWSLFNKAELYFNGVNVETIDDPGTVAQVMGLLDFLVRNLFNCEPLDDKYVFCMDGCHGHWRPQTDFLRFTQGGILSAAEIHTVSTIHCPAVIA